MDNSSHPHRPEGLTPGPDLGCVGEDPPASVAPCRAPMCAEGAGIDSTEVDQRPVRDEEDPTMAGTRRVPGLSDAERALADAIRVKRQQRLDKAKRVDVSALRDRRPAEFSRRAGSLALGSSRRTTAR